MIGRLSPALTFYSLKVESNLLKLIQEAGRMAQQVLALAAKSDILSVIPGT